jgi:hypothetical protein
MIQFSGNYVQVEIGGILSNRALDTKFREISKHVLRWTQVDWTAFESKQSDIYKLNTRVS